MANEERKSELEALRQYWKEQIESWQASGLSQSEFCQRHNLKLHRFVYWRKRFIRPVNPVCPQGIVDLPIAISAAKRVTTVPGDAMPGGISVVIFILGALAAKVVVASNAKIRVAINRCSVSLMFICISFVCDYL